MKLWPFRRRLQVPEYPMRCQHCDARIKLYAVPAPGAEATYAAPDKSTVCEPLSTDLIFHRPMPSIFG